MEILFVILLWVVGIVIWIVLWAQLAKRLGYKSTVGIGFLMAVPIVDFFVFLMLALTESPREEELRKLKEPPEEPEDEDELFVEDPPADYLPEGTEEYEGPPPDAEAHVAELIEVLREGEPTPCRIAVEELVDIGAPALPALEAALEEGDPDLAIDARRAIERIRDRPPPA